MGIYAYVESLKLTKEPVRSANAIRKQLAVEIYHKNIPAFSDRDYFEIKNDFRLNNLSLVVLPRHANLDIELTLAVPSKIYRFICERNQNDHYVDWQITNIEIKLPRCVHTQVALKYFDPGVHILPPGGPASSDPILINTGPKNISAYSVRY